MTNDSLEIELKLQLCDELADVLHIYRQEGSDTAQAALRRVIDNYSALYQDARILLVISAVETFIKDSIGRDILEIFELIGTAEVAIAGVEAST